MAAPSVRWVRAQEADALLHGTSVSVAAPTVLTAVAPLVVLGDLAGRVTLAGAVVGVAPQPGGHAGLVAVGVGEDPHRGSALVADQGAAGVERGADPVLGHLG